MSAKENLALVHELFAAQHARDAERFANCFADDGVWEVAGLATAKGRAEIVAFAEGTLRGYSDLEVRVVDAVADDKRVFAQVAYSARLTGVLQRGGLPPIQPTGRVAATKYMVRTRVEDGRVAELFQVTNALDVYRQFGVLT